MRPDLYTRKTISSFPHRRRLEHIFRVVDSLGLGARGDFSYADFGCDDGYVTDLVARRIGATRAHGFGHSDKIEEGKRRFPHIAFGHVELNEPSEVGPFDLVTCFETLEHVGNLETALDNLVRATADGGTLLVTVPIETGPIGLVKFLAKTVVYRYPLDELPGERLFFPYLRALLRGEDLGRFRDRRFGWGTHFGFDCRAVGRHFDSRGMDYEAWNVVTSRFFLVRRQSPGTSSIV